MQCTRVSKTTTPPSSSVDNPTQIKIRSMILAKWVVPAVNSKTSPKSYTKEQEHTRRRSARRSRRSW
ncbi:hypothetical protein DPMN_186699 [Dreissena polymorpha]|uniref:Uncharacterized protein n=1 Tax=Dreissena polymorpha TaxID=45954 RepID=A0A9D4DQT0_DREPO|nr:hypothetical protein DPMN_186699 [Dreissena polymorpha]